LRSRSLRWCAAAELGRDHQDLVIAAEPIGAHTDPVSAPRTVVLVAFDRLQLLDLVGPIEVFDAADRIRGGGTYEIVVATPDGARVRSSSRVDVGADRALTDLPSSFDTLVVVGGRGTRRLLDDEPFLEQVRSLSSRARRTTSVCSGALVLGAAGLLDGHRATTHWDSCDDLAGLSPEIEVLPDQIYVHDRDRWTSAGVTAGIDLALALVEDVHGPELAHEVAAWLVVFARRPGGQAQFSVQLQAQAARTPAVAEVQRWLPDHLAEDLTVDRLAERAAMSPRTFARTFRAETGTTPAVHVEELRVEAARRLLETTDLTIGAIAGRVGLKHAETLHRAFARRVGTTPDRYRQHFARTPA
jgi:transcriptional regulator GlxA family with amidase domain